VTVSDIVRADRTSATILSLIRQRAIIAGVAGHTPTVQEAARARAARIPDMVTTAAATSRLAEIRDPLARAVLDLHAPSDGIWPTCEGCDHAGIESEPPVYPCSTVELIAARYQIPMPTTWRTER